MAFKTLCYLLFLGIHSLYLSKQTMAFYTTVFAKTRTSWNVLSSSVTATGKLPFFLQEMTQDIISLKSLLNCALKVEIIFSSFAILESLYLSSSLWSFNSTCFLYIYAYPRRGTWSHQFCTSCLLGRYKTGRALNKPFGEGMKEPITPINSCSK